MNFIFLGITCLGIQFAAKFTGVSKKVPYDIVGLGGLLFLLGAASGLEYAGNFMHMIVGYVVVISPIMGWMCLLAASLVGLYDVVVRPLRLIPH